MRTCLALMAGKLWFIPFAAFNVFGLDADALEIGDFSLSTVLAGYKGEGGKSQSGQVKELHGFSNYKNGK